MTSLELFHKVDPENYSLFIYEVTRQGRTIRYGNSVKSLLNYSLSWGLTNQGKAYWLALYEKYSHLTESNYTLYVKLTYYI